MQLMKFSPLALVVASLMSSGGLAAKEWDTVAARATAADGYEVRANQFRVAKVPIDYFAGLQAGESSLTLPLPDGGEVTFTLQAYDLLPADQAAKFPEIKTFKGHNPAAPVETGRFDLGPLGFHAMFTHQGKTVFVDPLSNAEGYAVYYQQDAYSRLAEEADKVIGSDASKALAHKVQVDGNVRKRYVIAISAAGEYTQFHGGSKVLATAAIATLLNRVNEVSQRDVGAEVQLASGNDNILFTDPVHTINGLSSLTKYFQGLYSGSTFITFDFKETESSGETAFVRWEMAFSHLRLNHGEKISVPGVTFLVFAKDGKVERHQDYFDLGAMLYEHVPLLGRLISGIKKRLAS